MSVRLCTSSVGDAELRLHPCGILTETNLGLDDNLILLKGLKPDSPRYKKLDLEGQQIEGRLNELFKRKREIEAAHVAHVLTNDEISGLVQFRADTELGLANPTEADKRHWLAVLHTSVSVKGHITTVTIVLPVEAG